MHTDDIWQEHSDGSINFESPTPGHTYKWLYLKTILLICIHLLLFTNRKSHLSILMAASILTFGYLCSECEITQRELPLAGILPLAKWDIPIGTPPRATD